MQGVNELNRDPVFRGQVIELRSAIQNLDGREHQEPIAARSAGPSEPLLEPLCLRCAKSLDAINEPCGKEEYRENAAILDELSRLDMQARKRRILREPVSATWGEVDHAQSALARQMEALAVQLRMRDEEAAKVTTGIFTQGETCHPHSPRSAACVVRREFMRRITVATTVDCRLARIAPSRGNRALRSGAGPLCPRAHALLASHVKEYKQQVELYTNRTLRRDQHKKPEKSETVSLLVLDELKKLQVTAEHLVDSYRYDIRLDPLTRAVRSRNDGLDDFDDYRWGKRIQI
ncbi:hypothetical protein MMC12_004730 [Toensbergia leucococca]|nr:hypothetical protein [Toensbergia leucococca]